ncbi:MAG: glycosyltransferase [Akkermansiaceae bacterium]|nr:glycosyltransferase [Akkermansiaceae bacterium]
MGKNIIIYCNHISANVGVPGVNQALISDINIYSQSNHTVIGSDYNNYYRFNWSEDRSVISMDMIVDHRDLDASMVIFSGFDPLRWVLPKMLKWKTRNCIIACWTWGFFTKQQSLGNWEKGKVPGWIKRIAIFTKKYAIGPFVDYYLVSGEAEMRDSKLCSQKCVQMPMGRPQSAILDGCDEVDFSQVYFAEESLNYLGRGRWYEKGIADIVRYASTRNGKKWKYRFFISSRDAEFDEEVERHKFPNVEWFFDVFGKENIPWFFKCAAFITISRNPVQTRSSYEALYSGTPIVVLREGFMDGFKETLDANGLVGAIRVVSEEEYETFSFKIGVMDHESRSKLACVMKTILDAQKFGKWFGDWLDEPVAPASYYQHISQVLRSGNAGSD